MKIKTYKIYTLGCKVNQYDSGRLAGELVQAGLKATDKNADLAVVMSCAVTKTAMVKSGRMVKLAGKENPEAKIVLAGCLAKLEGKISNFKIPISNKISNPKCQIAKHDRARYFIKIQDGCEQFCSYCIIPYARGGLKSRGQREVIEEIKQAVKVGYREIVLSGIHLGLWGQENKKARKQKSKNDNLTSLLKKLIKIKNLGRIRLSSIEIGEVTDDLIKLMARSKKICRHLHLPLQSGSDKILEFMNRPYGIKNYEVRIKKLRKIIPDIAITTDVIVGFPGETEKDFLETKKFIKKIKFSRLHVFPFSAHERAAAAKMPNQLDEKIKKRRAETLRRLGVQLAENYKKKFKGRELAIVVERIKPGKIIGKTEFYFEIEAGGRKTKNGDLKTGEMVKIKY